ncbi:MAG: 5-oxoprolinase subunit PxpA [Thermovirgaceae bacterium]|nr:5-oxoprolinase subunit PxpA [Thermovirgaceae bacterium]
MARTIDLNSDLGEHFGAWIMGNDPAVMDHVSSANVACGFHAGDPMAMLRTVELAVEKGVAVGAHPGHPDLVGFGRRNIAVRPDEVYAFCLYQIGALRTIAASRGVSLQHVKPHGALYNQCASDLSLALAAAEAVRDAGGGLVLMGLANSCFARAAEQTGLPFAAEAFADRAYQADGSLVPRSRPGAVIHDPGEAASRVVEMVTKGSVTAQDGSQVTLKPQSICLHGDTPEAVEIARQVREALEAAGVVIAPLSGGA